LRKGFVFEETEAVLRKAEREQGKALADEFRDDAEGEFVDQIVLKKSTGEFTAPMCKMFFPLVVDAEVSNDVAIRLAALDELADTLITRTNVVVTQVPVLSHSHGYLFTIACRLVTRGTGYPEGIDGS
jgi:hypothetical protein